MKMETTSLTKRATALWLTFSVLALALLPGTVTAATVSVSGLTQTNAIKNQDELMVNVRQGAAWLTRRVPFSNVVASVQTNLSTATNTSAGTMPTNVFAASTAAPELRGNNWRTPPMGMEPYFALGPNATETNYWGWTDIIYTNGLSKLGWRWIDITDGWQAAARDGSNIITWDTTKFAAGIPALVNYMHARDCKAMLYIEVHSGAGTSNGGEPVRPDTFEEDMARIVSWGIDAIRYDNPTAWADGHNDEIVYWANRINDAFQRLAKKSVPIYSAGFHTNAMVRGPAGVNAFQVSHSIADLGGNNTNEFWTNMVRRFYRMGQYRDRSGPGHWAALDWLPLAWGKGHPSVYAMMSYPLFPATLPDADTDPGPYSVVTNSGFLKISQDMDGIPAECVRSNADYGQVWVKKLSDGSRAVMLFNPTTNSTLNIGFTLDEIGYRVGDNISFVNVWGGGTTNTTRGFTNAVIASDAHLFTADYYQASASDPNALTNQHTADVSFYGRFVVMPTNTILPSIQAWSDDQYVPSITLTNSYGAGGTFVGIGSAGLPPYGNIQFAANCNMDYRNSALWGATNQTVLNVPDSSSSGGGIQFRALGNSFARLHQIYGFNFASNSAPPSAATLGNGGVCFWNSNGVLYIIGAKLDASGYLWTNKLSP